MRDEKLVYIISTKQFSEQGWYKVGVASDYKSRLATYNTGSPYRDYKIYDGIGTDYWKEVENAIHNRFHTSHEWVKAPLEDIKECLRATINYYEQGPTWAIKTISDEEPSIIGSHETGGGSPTPDEHTSGGSSEST